MISDILRLDLKWPIFAYIFLHFLIPESFRWGSSLLLTFASYLRIIPSHQIFASYLRNKISSSLLSTPKKIEACFFARSANRVKTDAPDTSPKKSVATLSRFGRKSVLPCVLHMFVYINVILRHPYRCFAFLPFGRSLLMRFFAVHKRCAGMCPE